MQINIYLKRDKTEDLISLRGYKTKKKFAERINTTPQYLCVLLAGKVTVTTVMQKRFMDVLGGRGVVWDSLFQMVEYTTTTGSYA